MNFDRSANPRKTTPEDADSCEHRAHDPGCHRARRRSGRRGGGVLIRRCAIAGAVAAVLAVVAPVAAGAATRPLTTGFTDGVLDQGSPASDVWLGRARDAGAGIVLLSMSWSGMAPSRPANPADPSDPVYDWTATDAAVRAVGSHRLQIAMTVIYAPAWAEGPDRPADAAAGTWRPDAAALGAFMSAVARRYSGRFHTPGGVLPRVRYWQVWSEPNLFNHLMPQWTLADGRAVPASPEIYRRLLNAGYEAVKRVDPTNVVVTAATAPFGDRKPARGRIPPALFVRELFCLRGLALRRLRCPAPARFDVLAHHPYSVGPPSRQALNTDDVSLPDLGKLTGPLRVAERTGRALPRGRKRLWVTEFAYDSKPPDPLGVPSARHARWTQDALYLLWRQGVDAVVWFNLRDQDPVPTYAASYQSGLYLRDGRAKPALRAFRFPFVTQRIGAARLRAWTKVPAGGRLAIQRRMGAGWRTLATKRVRRGEVVHLHLRVRGAATLRARVGAGVSIARRQR